jgi:hypothetical protein
MQTAKIKSITYLGKEDVYNMEVDDHHNFSVNGGLIVHNCFDSVGYGLISHHARQSDTLAEQEKKRSFDFDTEDEDEDRDLSQAAGFFGI